MIGIRTRKAWPMTDSISNSTYPGFFVQEKNKYEVFPGAHYDDVVTLNDKGSIRRIQLKPYSEKRLKLTFDILFNGKPERLTHMRRFLYRDERIAISEGIRRQLAGEAPELFRRDEA